MSVAILSLVGIGLFKGGQAVVNYYQAPSSKAWFAAYVDVTATPTFQFRQLGSMKQKDAVLSFIVSANQNPCSPSWGGYYSISQADNSLNLATRIARLQQQGGSVAISFGGQKNQELASDCTDTAALYNAYQTVISHYHVNTIEFDLEGKNLSNVSADQRRAQVIAKLQKTERRSGHKLSIWLTLPVTPQGLNENAT